MTKISLLIKKKEMRMSCFAPTTLRMSRQRTMQKPMIIYSVIQIRKSYWSQKLNSSELIEIELQTYQCIYVLLAVVKRMTVKYNV